MSRAAEKTILELGSTDPLRLMAPRVRSASAGALHAYSGSWRFKIRLKLSRTLGSLKGRQTLTLRCSGVFQPLLSLFPRDKITIGSRRKWRTSLGSLTTRIVSSEIGRCEAYMQELGLLWIAHGVTE